MKRKASKTELEGDLGVFFFGFLLLGIILGGGVLVLLVLGNKVVHVRFGLGELHLVHTFAGVPVKEGLSSEHGGELLGHTLEKLLDGSGVSNECTGHLESSWWDVANGGLDVVWDPLDKVRRVLVLDVEHLLVNFLHGHTSSEDGGNSQVSTVTWIAGGHHVLGVEHLLGEFWDGQCSVLLGSTGGQWREPWDEEMKTWEWHHVDGELSEIGVKLTWESEASGNTRHGGGDQVVQVTVCWGGELEGSEANVVKGFVVNAVCLVSVLNQLVNRKGGVVWLDDGVGNFWRWHDGECVHDSVWVFFSDLGDQKCSEAGTGTATEGVCELETLEAIAAFRFLSDDIEHRVDEFGTFSVMTLGPVVTGTRLSEDKVIWTEDLAEWTRSDRVHGTRFKINKDSSWDVFTASGFVVVDVDSLQLEVGVTVVCTSRVNTMFIGDDLPELGTDLVTALAGLDVNNFSARIKGDGASTV